MYEEALVGPDAELLATPRRSLRVAGVAAVDVAQIYRPRPALRRGPLATRIGFTHCTILAQVPW